MIYGYFCGRISLELSICMVFFNRLKKKILSLKNKTLKDAKFCELLEYNQKIHRRDHCLCKMNDILDKHVQIGKTLFD